MSEEVNLQIQKLLGKIVDFIGIPSQRFSFKKSTIIIYFSIRLTNRSPFRNPRTPGKERLPLSTIANNNKGNQEFGSPKLANPKATLRHQQSTSSQRSPNTSRNTLLDCHLTAKQLSLKEVEDIWKNATLRHIEKLLGISSISSVLDTSQTTGFTLNIMFLLCSNFKLYHI